MAKQELSFGDKKEVCKVVLHRLIQVRLPRIPALTHRRVSQTCFRLRLGSGLWSS